MGPHHNHPGAAVYVRACQGSASLLSVPQPLWLSCLMCFGLSFWFSCIVLTLMQILFTLIDLVNFECDSAYDTIAFPNPLHLITRYLAVSLLAAFGIEWPFITMKHVFI